LPLANAFVTILFVATPTSRRQRPAKAPLSRQVVVDAALQLVEQEGLERVTMRRVAQELDTGPASLYVYVRNRADLHAALLDHVLSQLALPAGRQWRGTLVGLLADLTGLLHAHPALARSAMTLRPAGRNYLRLLDHVVSLLRQGGTSPRQAAWGADVLLLYVTAVATEQAGRDESIEAAGEDRHLTETLAALDGHEHPHLAWARDELLSGTPAQRLSWQLGLLIEGITRTPA